jgi:hypothetical protein
MTDLQVAMCCGTALAVAGIAWDAFKRHLLGVQKAAVDALESRLGEQLKAQGAAVTTLREDNRAEFLAMKTAFDRAMAKEATAAAFAPTGQSRRMF